MWSPQPLLYFLVILACWDLSSIAFHQPPTYHWSPSTRYFIRYDRSYFYMAKDWDAILAEEDDEPTDAPVVRPDMKYLPRNCNRQHQNFLAIREAAGPELTNDIYVKEPQNSETFWFAGKVARVSDVSAAQAVARQWPLMEQHAAHLRPLELFPARGSLEIWMAPGDSEMEVAYNNPDLKLQKMEKTVQGAEDISNNMVGFQGEMYEPGEQGFRTWRKQDGSPSKPPIQTPDQDELQTPSAEEMDEINKALEGKDINEIYEAQQKRDQKQ